MKPTTVLTALNAAHFRYRRASAQRRSTDLGLIDDDHLARECQRRERQVKRFSLRLRQELYRLETMDEVIENLRRLARRE